MPATRPIKAQIYANECLVHDIIITIGDAMALHNGRKFSTYDQDNDDHATTNCASLFKGGWWHANCHHANLNGIYYGGPHQPYAKGVNWRQWKGYYYSMKTSIMMIRPF